MQAHTADPNLGRRKFPLVLPVSWPHFHSAAFIFFQSLTVKAKQPKVHTLWGFPFSFQDSSLTSDLIMSWKWGRSCCPLSHRFVQSLIQSSSVQSEAIHWSQGHSYQWRSVLCSSSSTAGESEASSFHSGVARPPPAASAALRLRGWARVWLLRMGAGSFRCCCDSSSGAGCSWRVWAHRLKAPEDQRVDRWGTEWTDRAEQMLTDRQNLTS